MDKTLAKGEERYSNGVYGTKWYSKDGIQEIGYAVVMAIYVAQTAMITAITMNNESRNVTRRSMDIFAASGPITQSVKAEKAPTS